MSSQPKFFQPGTACHETYKAIRDSEENAPLKEQLEVAWAAYQKYCPYADFLSDAKHHFYQRTWELQLSRALIAREVTLQKPQAKGPDFQLEMPRVWIEAVSVGPGTTAAAVSPRRQRSFDVDHELFCLPSETSVLLHIASVFSTKSKKFKAYQGDRIVLR